MPSWCYSPIQSGRNAVVLEERRDENRAFGKFKAMAVVNGKRVDGRAPRIQYDGC